MTRFFLAVFLAFPLVDLPSAHAAAGASAKIASAEKPRQLLPNYRNVVLMPLSSLGSTEEAADAISRILSGEFQKLLGPKLLAVSDVRQRAKTMADQIESCDGVVDCLIEVFGAYGWDAFVVGNIAGLDSDRIINLKLYDAHEGKEIRRTSEKASGAEADLIKYMRKAAVQLLAPELFTGILEIIASQPDVQISIDGQLRATTPLSSPRLSVPVGKRAIEASGEGLVSFSTLVDVAYGEVVPITISLPENTAFVGGRTPFRNRWWTWGIAGTGAVAVGVGGVFNLLQHQVAGRIEERAQKGTLTIDNLDLYKEDKERWRQAMIFYGIGGVLLSTTAALLIADLF